MDEIKSSGGPITAMRPRRLIAVRVEQFLAYLAESCNVAASCRLAGLETSTVYRLRAADPAFAARWRETIEEGYLRLEGALLQQAMGTVAVSGEAGAVSDAAGSTDAGTEAAAPFDRELALKLLALRQRADAQGRRSGVRLRQPDTADALAALDRKLAAMEKRLRKSAEATALGSPAAKRLGKPVGKLVGGAVAGRSR